MRQILGLALALAIISHVNAFNCFSGRNYDASSTDGLAIMTGCYACMKEQKTYKSATGTTVTEYNYSGMGCTGYVTQPPSVTTASIATPDPSTYYVSGTSGTAATSCSGFAIAQAYAYVPGNGPSPIAAPSICASSSTFTSCGSTYGDSAKYGSCTCCADSCNSVNFACNSTSSIGAPSGTSSSTTTSINCYMGRNYDGSSNGLVLYTGCNLCHKEKKTYKAISGATVTEYKYYGDGNCQPPATTTPTTGSTATFTTTTVDPRTLYVSSISNPAAMSCSGYIVTKPYTFKLNTGAPNVATAGPATTPTYSGFATFTSCSSTSSESASFGHCACATSGCNSNTLTCDGVTNTDSTSATGGSGSGSGTSGSGSGTNGSGSGSGSGSTSGKNSASEVKSFFTFSMLLAASISFATWFRV